MDQVTELKKIRSSLSCVLSTIRREIKNPSLSKTQLNHKVARGLKTATKYVEVSDQLSNLGIRCEYKVPHMRPEWWEKYNEEFDGSDLPVGLVEPTTYTHMEKIDKNITDIIKDTIKSELNNLVVSEKSTEYIFNIAWSDNTHGDNCIVNNLKCIIEDYLTMLKVQTIRKEQYDDEYIYTYMCSGDKFDIIKRSIQFMIDRWGDGTNMSVYGKLNKFQ